MVAQRSSTFGLLVLLPLLWLVVRPAHAQGRVNYADWRLEWAEEFNGMVGGYWRPLCTKDISCLCLFYSVDPTANLLRFR